MKTYVLFITLNFLVVIASPGKIKNGYGIDIEGAHKSLKSLQSLLTKDHNLSFLQKASMRNKINKLRQFITYYELTEKLLEQFKVITPDLYHEIDTITDYRGRPLDVYVKFLPEADMPKGVAGTTNISQENDDENAYSSEYGAFTVSVKIAAVKKALFFLAHELGHVRYQVPNLASYIQYHSKYYLANSYTAKSMGHNDSDPSGQNAHAYAIRFQEKYLVFLKSPEAKVDSPLALLQIIKTQFQ